MRTLDCDHGTGSVSVESYRSYSVTRIEDYRYIYLSICAQGFASMRLTEYGVQLCIKDMHDVNELVAMRI